MRHGASYRRDDFQRAAPLFRAAGSEVFANKLESFKGLTPYRIEGPADVARIKFVHTDPLPLIQVEVNSSEEVNFTIDTGASEVYADGEYAKKIGAATFGSKIYGGGLDAATGQGRTDAPTSGEFVVRSLPVHILDTRRFSAAARGKQVDGTLGTPLLSHFISTLDYPDGELILRRKTEDQLKWVEQEAGSDRSIVVPFWMAGDHYMVAWGEVNMSGRSLGELIIQ